MNKGDVVQSLIHAKSPHTRGVHEKSGGFVNAGGVGTRKNSVHFPRGVHAARQKHAPCVGLELDLPSITTQIPLPFHLAFRQPERCRLTTKKSIIWKFENSMPTKKQITYHNKCLP